MYKRSKNGILFVVAIMATITSFAYLMMGGTWPDAPQENTTSENPGKQDIVFEQVTDPAKKNLQLQTFTVKNACTDKIAVDFLIDVSGSMQQDGKIGKTRTALRAFTDRMSDSSVIGMQIFSDPDNVKEIIPLGLYTGVKVQEVKNAITNLRARGSTSTRSGFKLAYEKLSQAIGQNKFPRYKYNLVFLSDGVPEIDGIVHNDANCLARAPIGNKIRCFAKEQDPRGTPTDPEHIPSEIDTLGVDIYSIAITSRFDAGLKEELLQLLRDVSSDPDSKYFYESIDGDNLTTVLDTVLKSICGA